MANEREYPMNFTARGLSDAWDSTLAFPGSCTSLKNLIFDMENPEQVIARPGVGSPITSFSVSSELFWGGAGAIWGQGVWGGGGVPGGVATSNHWGDGSLWGTGIWGSTPGALEVIQTFASPTFVSVHASVGTVIFGMVSVAGGKDVPFAFDTATYQFISIAGVTAANTPVSQPTTGDTIVPTISSVGTSIIVTHPGFSGQPTSGAFRGSVNGSVLTISNPTGTINIGDNITHPHVATSGALTGAVTGNVLVVTNASGTINVGDKLTLNPVPTTGAFTGSITGSVLTITNASGTISIGDTVTHTPSPTTGAFNGSITGNILTIPSPYTWGGGYIWGSGSGSTTVGASAPGTTGSFMGSITGNILTIQPPALWGGGGTWGNGIWSESTTGPAGTINIGDILTGAGIPANTLIASFVGGTIGGVGTYTLSNSMSSPITTESMTTTSVSIPPLVTVIPAGSNGVWGTGVTGTISVGSIITGYGIPPNTMVESFVSGTNGGVGTYILSNTLTTPVLSEPMTTTSVDIPAGTKIVSFTSGIYGGNGVYVVNTSTVLPILAESMNTTGTGIPLPDGTTIASFVSGIYGGNGTYTISTTAPIPIFPEPMITSGFGVPLPAGTSITSFISGTYGGTGVYGLSTTSSNPITAEAMISAGSQFFGVIDMSNLKSPYWYATNIGGYGLPSVPDAVANYNNRAYFACGNQLPYSDSLVPTQRTNGTQSLTLGDTTPITALSGLPVSTTSSGVIAALVVFKKSSIWQVTGDSALGNLAESYLTLNIGCSSPRTVVQTPTGMIFIAVDGPYYISATGIVAPLSNGSQGTVPDLQIPFKNISSPTRASASYAGNVYRVCLDTTVKGVSSTNDYWFDVIVRRWTGPHTFPYDCASSIGNLFVLTSRHEGAALFESEYVSDASDVYQDNGVPINVNLTSSMFPKSQNPNMKQVIESTIEFGSAPGLTNYAIQAVDDIGTVIGTSDIYMIGSGHVWGDGVAKWGDGKTFWVSASKIPETYTVTWPNPLVFKKMLLNISQSATYSTVIGAFSAKYRDCGYYNQSIFLKKIPSYVTTSGVTTYATSGDAQAVIVADLSANLSANPGSIISGNTITYPDGSGVVYNLRQGQSSGNLTEVATYASGNYNIDFKITPDGNHAYATNHTDGTVSQYSVVSGALVPLSPATVTADTSPVALAIHPSGNWLYATAGGSGATSVIKVYGIGAGGLLTLVQTVTGLPQIGGWGGLNAFIVDPTGSFAYGLINYTVKTFTISSGLLTLAGSVTLTYYAAVMTTSMALSANGNYLYVCTNSYPYGVIYQFTVTGATLTPLGGYATTQLACYCIALSQDGLYAYVTSEAYDYSVVQFAISGGVMGASGIAGWAISPGGLYGLVISPDGKNLYTSGVDQFSIGAGGALAPLSPPSLPNGYSGNSQGMAISADGLDLYECNGSTVIYRYTMSPGPYYVDYTTNAAPVLVQIPVS
jgi:hypothetical protein